MKKTFWGRIALVMLIALTFLLVSCGEVGDAEATDPIGSQPNADSVTGSTEESQDIETSKPFPVISEGSTVRYTLIRPDEIDEEFFSVFMAFQTSLEMLTGGTVEAETDILMPGQSEDHDRFEILFGNCNRMETDSVKYSIGFHDWTIRAYGNKIIIFGHTYDTLKAAAEYCAENLILRDEATGNVTLSGEYTYTSKDPFLFSATNPISGYTIVYPDGNDLAKKLAERVSIRIERQMGFNLPVVSDATEEQECEILIGYTSRESAGAAFVGISPVEYCIRVIDKKLVIGAPADFALENGLEVFLANYFSPSPYTDVLNFSTYCNIREVAYFKRDGADLYGDADLRVMSWNILTELWNDKTPVEVRDEEAAAAILYYNADVVGLQEVSANWYKALKPRLVQTYSFVTEVNEYGTINYSTMIYNKNTVRIIEQGVENFSVGTGTMRLITWALFERISDGERFIVTSTHWDTDNNRITVHSAEMAEIVNRLYQKYQVPMFCTGDYNRTEDTKQFTDFLQKTGFKDARTFAETVGEEGKTHHSVLKDMPSEGSSGKAIDHITVSPDSKTLYYTRLTDAHILAASDHCPIYIDVKLGS